VALGFRERSKPAATLGKRALDRPATTQPPVAHAAPLCNLRKGAKLPDELDFLTAGLPTDTGDD
jgi:hypothetical protein